MKYRKSAEDLTLIRSQGRKRLRAALLASDKPFECELCGWIPTPPLHRGNTLDANHKSKDLSDNDAANGQWLCRTCHKREDSKTAKGISQYGEVMGYDLDNL